MQDNTQNIISEQGKTASEAGKVMLKQAQEHFNKNEWKQSLQIYSSIIDSVDPTITLENKLQAIRNRSALYFSQKKYSDCISDCKDYLKLNLQPNCPQIYVIYISGLIKSQKLQQAIEISQKASELFPFHKKIKQLQKQTKQMLMTETEQTYVDNMFEKLCSHPKIRQWLKEQSFLTKVQRLIRNPSLTSTLAKADPRIAEVADFMMMAEENQ